MDIFQCATKLEDYLIRCRRHLYENPEVSDKEYQTLAFIRAELKAAGINYTDIPQGGILVTIDGPVAGKTVFLRADMDALPIQEEPCNTKQPKTCLSRIEGVAHLCGHDAHVAMLLGAARILHQHRNEIEGRVLLFFEQGEESGSGDVYLMHYVEQHRVHIDGCWALHVFPALESGKVGLIPGGIFAGSVGWRFTIAPKDKAADSVACAASIINALYTARLSTVSPLEPLTVAACMFRTNGDGSCTIGGTCRFYEQVKAGLSIKRALRRIASATCDAYGCEITDTLLQGPTEGLLNDPTCVDIAKVAVADTLGSAHVSGLEPTMYGECFTVYSSQYPSVMAMLGIRNEERGIIADLHNPHFEVDEAALKYGVTATVAYALAFLRHKEPIPFEKRADSYDALLRARAME